MNAPRSISNAYKSERDYRDLAHADTQYFGSPCIRRGIGPNLYTCTYYLIRVSAYRRNRGRFDGFPHPSETEYRPCMRVVLQWRITYCSAETTRGKKKKNKNPAKRSIGKLGRTGAIGRTTPAHSFEFFNLLFPARHDYRRISRASPSQ